MQKRTFASVGLAGVLFASGLYGGLGFGASAQVPSPVSAAVGVEAQPSSGAKPSVATAAVAAAKGSVALPSSRLAREIEWQFGGKTQRGWYLYTSLIQQIVGTEAEADSPEFTSAVARWKRSAGLPESGDLDTRTWIEMMNRLQKARRFDSTQPPANELVEAPASIWLYPDRPAANRMLRRDAYDAYLRMVKDARAELGASVPADHFKLVSGHRSPEYQKMLRATAGNPTSTAGLAKNSPHFSGRAIDLYVGGEPVSTKDANRAIQVSSATYKWLAKNAYRYGFRPYFYEPWHWEFDPALATK